MFLSLWVSIMAHDEVLGVLVTSALLRGGISPGFLGSLFASPQICAKLSPLGFWCWPDSVGRPVGGSTCKLALADSIVFLLLQSSSKPTHVVVLFVTDLFVKT